MPHATLFTATIQTPTVVEVAVEVDIHPGLPTFSIVGLPDKQIAEARDRVRAAIKNSGFDFPMGHIMVNLAPSAIPKRGTGFDLAIALGILTAAGLVPISDQKIWYIGELGLIGEIRTYPHLAAVLVEARKRGIACVIPKVQQGVAALVAGVSIRSCEFLSEAVSSKGVWKKQEVVEVREQARKEYTLDSIKGNRLAKRGLLVALAGKHSLLLSGPPGMGKTMLLKAAHELLPLLTADQALELAQLYAFAEEPGEFQLGRPPYRAPSSRVTRAGLYGGGNPIKPGEINLAHRGIIFLDELPLLEIEAIEGLRQVMDERVTVHNRQGKRVIFPADCIVVAARNLCRCGREGVDGQECACTTAERLRYSLKLSEPLLDRFELFCDVPYVSLSDWKEASHKGEEYAATIARVWGGATVTDWSPEAQECLSRATERLRLSGRARESVRKVAETISKVEASSQVQLAHVQEALQYRRH